MISELEAFYERVLARPGIVLLLGGIDAGKTTVAVELLRRGIESGLSVGLGDVGVDQAHAEPALDAPAQ
ncbi:MAG TPA: hypothetical protein VFF07_16395 [Actinomycetota bacterium]|nr:hypothetical protein [Actinomycetota bacterium]